MSNWNFCLDQNFLSRFFAVFLGSIILVHAQGQTPFSASLAIKDNYSLLINSSHTTQDLEKHLLDFEYQSGLQLNAYLIDTSVSFFPSSGTNRYHLNFSEDSFVLGFYLKHLQRGDSMIAHYPERSDTFICDNADSLFYWQGKPNLSRFVVINSDTLNAKRPALAGVSLRNKEQRDFGDAGACQVNAQCLPENEHPNSAKSTVRILWRNRNLQGWCTGHLVNNSAYDYRPFLLTAEHCALVNGLASSSDLNQWIFYFNYESARCSTPASDQGLDGDFISGAQLIAQSNDNGGDFGSDFLLLELNRPVPESFNAFYVGWNRSTLASNRGLCYHHPAGDLKKVSTFKVKPFLGSFGQINPNTHWVTQWSATPNGHGTTEGGSSGSALLDENGLVLGILTGGASSCDATSLFDFYGTLAYGWESNGNQAQNQLRPWLDPLKTGLLKLNGAFQGDPKPDLGTGELAIAPNPVENKLLRVYQVSNFNQPVTIQIFSLSGQLVFKEETAPLPGQLPSFKLGSSLRGFYIVRLKQGAKSHTQRLWIH